MTPFYRGQVAATLGAAAFLLILVSVVMGGEVLLVWLALTFLGLSMLLRLLGCRCATCGKSLFVDASVWPPQAILDLFRPAFRAWPERRCSRCGAVQDD